MSGHPSATGRAQDKESSSAKDRRSTAELYYTQPTLNQGYIWRYGIMQTGPPEIPGNLQSPKFPAGIPGNFEDFPKLSFFPDSDSSILRKTRLFRITFW